MLHQALGLFDDHLGNLHVTRRRLIERRAHHLAVHRPLHVGNFFRTLVDKEKRSGNTPDGFAVMLCATFCKSTVLPVRGGDTINAR